MRLASDGKKEISTVIKKIRIIIADDHTLLRAGIRTLFTNMEGVSVVGEAGDGQEALRLAQQERPDIVLSDISMPLLNGLELATRITREMPEVRVIILSMHASEEFITRALEAGARGYVLKGATPEELEAAIRAVADNGMYLCSAVSGKVVDEYLPRLYGGAAAREKGNRTPFHDLTSRQREILQMIAEGNSNKDIAQKLTLSVKTVETHRAQIMARLNIHETAGLVRYAIRCGIVSSE